jgi:aspartate 1-decarboxylase|tara:strand:- start:15808 stop:16158 length:351 start_codon:yes stop_codon:yes gene_type:complete
MKIEVLKTKISHIKVTSSHKNDEGVIRMSKSLMEEGNLVNYEKVMIINEDNGGSANPKFAFVESFEKDVAHRDISTPSTMATFNDTITIISVGTATVDEPIKEPILINMKPFVNYD